MHGKVLTMTSRPIITGTAQSLKFSREGQRYYFIYFAPRDKLTVEIFESLKITKECNTFNMQYYKNIR